MAGDVPLASDILNAIGEEVKEKENDKTAHLTQQEKGDLIRAVSLSALKFTILKSKPGQNINFDSEKSLSFEGDSGPYLQYACVRANSVLEKVPKGVKGHPLGQNSSRVPLGKYPKWQYLKTQCRRW